MPSTAAAPAAAAADHAVDEDQPAAPSPSSLTPTTMSDVLARLCPLAAAASAASPSAGWDWSAVLAIEPRPPGKAGRPSSSLEQVQAITQTKEGRTTVNVDLGQLCRRALEHVRGQSAEDEFSQRFLHFLQRVLDPTQVRQSMKEAQAQTTQTERDSTPPVAAIAAALVPVYEVLADALTQYAGEKDAKASNPFLSKLVDSTADVLRSSVHPNSHGSVLACCYLNPRMKKLATELSKQTFTSAEEYPAASLAAVALEGAAVMRIIVEKRLTARGPKDFDLFTDGVPACLRVEAAPAMSPESAVVTLQRVIASVQAMNARILTKYVEIFHPTWLSLPAAALVLETLSAAARPSSSTPGTASSVAASPTADSSIHAAVASSSSAAASSSAITIPAAAFSPAQRSMLFSSCLQLLCALVPQLDDEKPFSGVDQQPLPGQINAEPFRRHIGNSSSSQHPSLPSSSPLHLHFHAQLWVSRVREGAMTLSIFGNQEKYLQTYTPVVKLRLLELMHTLAVQSPESGLLPVAALSAPTDPSVESPPAMALVIASCFWRDLECDAEVAAVAEYIKLLSAVLHAPPAGRLQPLPTVEERSAREALDQLIQAGKMVGIEELLQLTNASGEDAARLICLVMQNALVRWPNMDESLIRGMQEFVLKQLPLLIETEVVEPPAECEGSVSDQAAASSASASPAASHPAEPSSSAPPPPTFESDSLHLCDNALQDGLYTVLRRFEQYFPEYAPESEKSRAPVVDGAEDVKDEKTSVKLSSMEESKAGSTGDSSLPTWLPAVDYSGVDDLDPLARQYRGFGTSTNDQTGDFHPSQAAARENDPRRLFTGALKSTMRTMKLHSQFLLDQTREHVRRVHRCERMLESSRQLDPALKAEQREERTEMKQRVKLKGKGCEPPPIIAEAIRRQKEKALSQRKLQSGEDEDVEMKDSESTVEAGKSSTDRESSVSPLPASHLARSDSLSLRSMTPGDILGTSSQLVRDFSLTTFISSLLLDLIIPRDDADRVVLEAEEEPEEKPDGMEEDGELQPASSSMFNPRWYALLLLYPDSDRPEMPSLHSARDIISTLLRVIDACMEAVSSEARLLESLLTCRLSPAVSASSHPAASFLPEDFPASLASSLSALQTLHSSLILLTDLHALYPEDSEEAWNRMVVGLEAACVAMEQLMRQQNVVPENEHSSASSVSGEFLSQLTSIRTLLSPHHAAALDYLKEKRAELKRKRAREAEQPPETEPTGGTEPFEPQSGKRRRTHTSSPSRVVRSSHSYTHPILDAFSSRDAELSDDPENDQQDFRELEEFLAQDPCSVCQREAEEEGDEQDAIAMQCCRTCHKPVCLECAPLVSEGKKFRCANCRVRKQHRTPA